MKTLVLILFYFIPSAYSAPKNILSCLGLEEKFYHEEKIKGPYYYLNQKIISELLQISSEVKLKEEEVNEVCKNEPHPSLLLLEKLLIKRENIFQKIKSKDEIKKLSAINSKDELLKEAPLIFLDFISKLQESSPTINCLKEKIPALKYTIDRNLYLKEELPLSKIIPKEKELKEIFKKLKNANDLFKDCKSKKNLK